jgi:hypothetical protein
MKVGDLVRAKPGTVEGGAEKLGIGIIVSQSSAVGVYGESFVWVRWFNDWDGGQWMRYMEDLERVSYG